MARPVVRDFLFDFAGPVSAVWTAMADTGRYNAAAGLPRYQVTETLGADGGTVFHGRARFGPLTVEWEDLPCNWVRGHWVEHRRRILRGPLTTLDARLDLVEQGSGCRGTYRISVTPRGLAGRALLAAGFLRGAERMFRTLAAQADRFATGASQVPFLAGSSPVTGAARTRLDTLAHELDASAYGHDLGRLLASEVGDALEPDAERIRPLGLARRWGVAERHVVEACLQAVRIGMLELRWDLLCPRCRGAKATATALDQVPTGAHCATCNIDYGRDFSRNLELTFRAAPSIRPLGEGEFCLLGPMSTPHILVHVTLEPGERRSVGIDLAQGLYRLRTLEPGPELDLEHGSGEFPATHLRAGGIGAGPPSPPGRIDLWNEGPYRRTLVIEDRRWVADALTADRAATFQAFRDLCSTEVMRPGDEVAIGRVALLFSDLKGSTALYEAVGDAAAYRLVRAHFAYLAAIVREHDGAIVKTIGDAVMAAFHDPVRALQAALAMQDRVRAFNERSATPVVLKLGLHEGPCIAVTLNDRLDYFGQTVNLAARLQGESRGGDIVLSLRMASRPGTDAILAERPRREEEALLRGVVAPVRFLRLLPQP